MLAALSVTGSQAETQAAEVADQHKVLMGRIAEYRDRAAFKALFVHFGPRIRAFMLKSGANMAQADDLVQDVMLTVWRKVHLYKPERGSVSAWVFTIARNARIDRLRSSSSRAYEDLENVEIASDDASGEDVAQANQTAELVADAVAALPEEQRQIITMAYVEDISQSEIAERLGVPLGTVKSRMRLAYTKLKVRLEGLQ